MTPELENIKVFEDITVLRIRFINLMRDDDTAQYVWTREEVINYKPKNDLEVYRIESLYDGGCQLQYNINDVRNCFNNQSR